MAKTLKTVRIGFAWNGNRSICIRQKIVEGPKDVLDRFVNLDLSFEDVNNLVEQMKFAVKRLDETEKRLTETNIDNTDKEEV